MIIKYSIILNISGKVYSNNIINIEKNVNVNIKTFYVDYRSNNQSSFCGESPLPNQSCQSIQRVLDIYKQFHFADGLKIVMANGTYNSSGNSELSVFDIDLTIGGGEGGQNSGGVDDDFGGLKWVQIDLGGKQFINMSEPKDGKPEGIYTRLTLNNLLFRNGYASGEFGGAVVLSSHLHSKISLTINNCTFINNTAEFGEHWGGVITIRSSSIVPVNFTLRGCLFQENNGNSRQVIFADPSNTVIENCNFSNNKVSNFIVNIGFGSIVIKKSRFIDNIIEKGSFVKAFSNNGFKPAVIIGCRFINNSVSSPAPFNGMSTVFYIWQTSSVFTNNLFRSNVNCSQIHFDNTIVISTRIYNSTFSENIGNSGVGIYSRYGTLFIANSTFNNNTGYLGNHLYIDGAKKVSILNSSFSNSPPLNFGDGQSIYLFYAKNVSITHSSFSKNGDINIYCYASHVFTQNNTMGGDSKLVKCGVNCHVRGQQEDCLNKADSSDNYPNPNDKQSTYGILVMSIVILVSLIIVMVVIYIRLKKRNYNRLRTYLLSPYRCLIGTCQQPVKQGGSCEYTFDCNHMEGDYCVETDPGVKVCLPANFGYFNEECTRQSYCILGLECNTDNICDVDNGTSLCVPQPNLNPHFGICKITTEVSDPYITTRTTCDFFKNQYCIITNGTSFGKCTNSPEPTYRLCNRREECNHYEFCLCDFQ
ncbi:hypothetical protein PPL_00036 [Heterostelium album PN500]|uniref:Right handed beta helix domain-containing protein n=1 Tax=Heterostelium pallidum (strain ATCC 26659 / Pp 5 / PN500) TaxID=670386 RepID=D3BVN5_HETP5|nr:hypothetical protein PPL_00036 [Heterostelium album PN500]EFA74538.1 hypothetical protein PPL_00036 [Heterostelium album PN500]|eukprot:XP_020426672.1 hypothetical protein PPL_00036 [Heterostelium album PN500]